MLIDKLAWICFQEGRMVSTKSKGKDVRYIPGGKREAGESDTEALCREIREELNVELLPASLELYGIFEAQAHGHAEGVVVRMTCYTAAFSWVLAASAEIEEYARLSYADKEKTSPVDHLIFDDAYHKGLLR